MAGDGNVMVSSAFILEGDKYIIQGDHMEILFKGAPILRRKLS
jgi:hypothetical protein